MKYVLLIITLATFNFTQAQNETKIYGDLQIVTGMTVSGESLQHATLGANVVLPNSLYLRIGGDLALGGSFTNPNALISYVQYGFRLGLNREISEKFSVRPYLGGGYQSAIVTTSQSNSTIDDINAVGAGVETRYQSELISSISVPIGVDFHFHKKSIGFVAGTYIHASQFTELGIRIGMTFGKL